MKEIFFESYRRSLIELIIWYRDDYHRQDCGHSQLIERLKEAASMDDIDPIDQILDGWLNDGQS